MGEVGKRAAKGAWYPNGVRAWTGLAKEARPRKEETHVGPIFGMCVATNPELATGHPERTVKGKLVDQGSGVIDERAHDAILRQLSSNPVILEAPMRSMSMVWFRVIARAA